MPQITTSAKMAFAGRIHSRQREIADGLHLFAKQEVKKTAREGRGKVDRLHPVSGFCAVGAVLSDGRPSQAEERTRTSVLHMWRPEAASGWEER
jgi:hypothetical protein